MLHMNIDNKATFLLQKIVLGRGDLDWSTYVCVYMLNLFPSPSALPAPSKALSSTLPLRKVCSEATPV